MVFLTIPRMVWRHLCQLLLLPLLAVIAVAAPPQEEALADISSIQEGLTRADEALKKGGLDVRELEALAAELTRWQGEGHRCVETEAKHLEVTQRFVAALGEPVPDEPEHLAAGRVKVLEEQRRTEARLAECRLMVVRTTELSTRLGEQLQQLRTRDLYTRGDSLPRLMVLVAREGFSRERLERIWVQLQVHLLSWQAALVLAIAAGGALAGSLAAGPLARRFGLEVPAWTRCLVSALSAVTASLLSGWLLLDALRTPPSTATRLLSACAMLTTLAVGLIRRDTTPPPGTASVGVPVFVWSCLLAIVGTLVISPPNIVHVSPPLLLARACTVALFCLASLWLARTLRPGKGNRTGVFLRGPLAIFLGCILLAELSGYRDLAGFMLGALGGSLLLLWLTSRLCRILPAALSGLSHGALPWQVRVRTFAGLENGVVVSGLVWLSWLLRVLLWLGCLLALLRLWDAGGQWSRRALDLYFQGFSLGSMPLNPSRILLGLLVFCLGWSLLVPLRQRIARAVTSDDEEPQQGDRETMGTLAGYVGYALVIFISLVVGGGNFTGLAVVAGGFSVGIAFGMQNIVNNFVSGLILLFERPIKRGDWIQVGDTEGYVKRISVRSTVIQTFENADVIVPNSELISSQVINLMYDDDRRGRLRIPVGVAYGSDTSLVESLLIDLARRHPNVLVGSSLPDPCVLFLRFGESSLDFELSCYLRNIDSRVRVRSDLLHAIDRAFREHNIEIPFPQRDVHIRQAHPMVLSSSAS